MRLDDHIPAIEKYQCRNLMEFMKKLKIILPNLDANDPRIMDIKDNTDKFLTLFEENYQYFNSISIPPSGLLSIPFFYIINHSKFTVYYMIL